MTTPKQILTDKIHKWVGDEKRWRYIATKQHVIRHLKLTASEFAEEVTNELIDAIELKLIEKWNYAEVNDEKMSMPESIEHYKNIRNTLRKFLQEIREEENEITRQDIENILKELP